MTTNFVFWQSYLMSHQAAYIRALAERPGCRVRWVVEQPLPEHYRRRGYVVPALGGVDAVIGPDAAQVRQILADDPGRTVHVFMGLGRRRLSGQAFRVSRGYPVRRLLLSENRFEFNWRLPFRWALYLSQAVMHRRWLERVLCMGYGGTFGGRNWFRLCGYPDSMISPFLYTSEEAGDIDATRLMAPADANAGHEVASDEVASHGMASDRIQAELVFVGQLIRRKGLDLLLRAMAKGTEPAGWRLTVVGSGPREAALRRQAQRLGLQGRVRFLGHVEHARIGALLSRHRVLVLPSRYDGWGAVVNEALLAGTPVVCSDRVGAADLVRGSGYGRVFRSGDVADLGRAIGECLRVAACTSQHAGWVAFCERMRGPRVAQYLEDVVASGADPARRPAAPWLGAAQLPPGRTRPSGGRGAGAGAGAGTDGLRVHPVDQNLPEIENEKIGPILRSRRS